MLTRSKSIPIPIKKLLPGVTLRAEPRSDDESDSDGDERGNLKDFVEYKKSTDKPHDHIAIDKKWNEWQPTTKGGKRYKRIVEKFSKK